MAKVPLTKPGMKTIAKTMVFDPDEWTAFEERTRQIGISPSTFFRKIVTDYLNDRYVNFDTTRTGVVDELRKRRDEIGLSTVQPVLDIILAEWLESRKKSAK